MYMDKSLKEKLINILESKGISIDKKRMVKKVHLFKYGGLYILPITKNIGIILETLENANKKHEFYTQKENPIEICAKYYINKEYLNNLIEINGIKYHIMEIIEINYKNKKLYFDYGGFPKTIKRMWN